jgi:hypothetical protein
MIIYWLHLIACAFMTGLIWEVQRVHYPMFLALRSLPLAEFQQWMNFHTVHVSIIVGPMMLFEAATGALLVLYPPDDMPQWLTLLNLVLIAIIFVATAFFSVPNHHHLREQGFDETVIKNLVNGNWIRTLAWSLRLLLLTRFLLQYSQIKLP